MNSMRLSFLHPLLAVLLLPSSEIIADDLFSVENLPKWKMAGPGSFELSDGVATVSYTHLTLPTKIV